MPFKNALGESMGNVPRLHRLSLNFLKLSGILSGSGESSGFDRIPSISSTCRHPKTTVQIHIARSPTCFDRFPTDLTVSNACSVTIPS
ncbi:unnamed protein product [Adineta ricciae]|uniref:Uncharacterized protein n=1 Tax=Adineta ricciae TaxID=249248 RepID=A0A815NJS0_ADIRI|nr:unnamed protein product [Adineta ricciae]